jgi:hypothetical protein
MSLKVCFYTAQGISASFLTHPPNYAAALATAGKMVSGIPLPEFNPDKVHLFVAKSSRGRHDSTNYPQRLFFWLLPSIALRLDSSSRNHEWTPDQHRRQ